MPDCCNARARVLRGWGWLSLRGGSPGRSCRCMARGDLDAGWLPRRRSPGSQRCLRTMRPLRSSNTARSFECRVWESLRTFPGEDPKLHVSLASCRGGWSQASQGANDRSQHQAAAVGVSDSRNAKEARLELQLARGVRLALSPAKGSGYAWPGHCHDLKGFLLPTPHPAPWRRAGRGACRS